MLCSRSLNIIELFGIHIHHIIKVLETCLFHLYACVYSFFLFFFCSKLIFKFVQKLLLLILLPFEQRHCMLLFFISFNYEIYNGDSSENNAYGSFITFSFCISRELQRNRIISNVGLAFRCSNNNYIIGN